MKSVARGEIKGIARIVKNEGMIEGQQRDNVPNGYSREIFSNGSYIYRRMKKGMPHGH